VPTPFVPGHEFAGTVRAIGDGVSGYEVGERILSLVGMGGFASQIPMQPMMAMKVPDSLSTPQAGSLLQAYSTALIALTKRLDVQPGERVLVLGAGGGVGLATVDVCRALDATVIAAASTKEKRDLAAAQGAAVTIDYENEDLTSRAKEAARELGGGVDVVVDLVGGRHSAAALAALTSKGRLGVLGLASGDAELTASQILRKNRSAVGIDCGDFSINDPMAYFQVMLDALNWAREKRISPVEPTARPLESAAETMADLMGRRDTGKVVLTP
jgi:NADPH2:quinone reductase